MAPSGPGSMTAGPGTTTKAVFPRETLDTCFQYTFRLISYTLHAWKVSEDAYDPATKSELITISCFSYTLLGRVSISFKNDFLSLVKNSSVSCSAMSVLTPWPSHQSVQ